MSAVELLPRLVYAAIVCLSFMACATLTPLVGRVASALGMVAHPRGDRWHKAPTPLLGGTAIFVSCVMVVAVFAVWDARLVAVLAGASLLFLAGLLDDVLHLRPHTKLLIQIVAACILVIGGVKVETVSLSVIAVPLTIIWVVGLTNAFNLLDNMDGLAAGIAAITALVLFMFGTGAGDEATAILALAIMGSSLGFLLHNFNPARIFMGDSGSMFIGFMLSAITLLGTSQMASDLVLTLLVPVAIMGLPIFDTTLVTIARTISGRSIAQGGRDHISHRLVALGLNERQTAITLYVIAGAFGGLAVLSRSLGFWPTIGLAALMLAATAVFGAFLGQVRIYSEDVLREQSGRDPSAVRTTIGGVFMYKRELAQLMLDALLIGAAYLGAYLLKYGAGAYALASTPPDLTAPWPRQFSESVPFVVAIKLAALVIFQLYRGMWRYVGPRDLFMIGQAVTVGSGAALLIVPLLLRHEVFPRSLFVIDWLLLLVLLVGSRASFVVLADTFRRLQRSLGPRVIIIGAGDAGEMVLRFVLRTGARAYQPVGFLDNDPAMRRRAIHGVRVIGTVEHLPSLITPERPGLVVLAVPSNSAMAEQVLAFCAAHGIPCYDAASFVHSELALQPAIPSGD